MIVAFSDISIALALLMLLSPLAAFVMYLLLRNDRAVVYSAIGLAAVSFVSAIVLFAIGSNKVAYLDWLKISTKTIIPLGIKIDPLASIVSIVVTFVALLVNIYSVGYMKGDPSIRRYFGLLGLFAFSMLGIVLSPNLVMLFVFWELVGFSSYLLIGFWFSKAAASWAAFKAFIVNRVGDMGFLMAIALTWAWFGSTDIDYLSAKFSAWQWTAGSMQVGDYLLTTAHLSLLGIGIFMGVVGKSAQFPLLVWLPDAMEGPTPVSALIHAATMVAAGVFLLARVFALLSPDVFMLITITGSITALMGAIAAMQQYDIKKVLAYSTISQLGYMVVGIGVGAWFPAVLHLITHAFFKAGLFLTAGSVIHALHHAGHGSAGHFDAQDMRTMGGLKSQMPVTFWSYLIAMLSLVGVPLFSGFLSKDAIILGAWQWANIKSGTGFSLYHLVPLLALAGVALTAYYMGRQLYMVFLGKARMPFQTIPAEVPKIQYIPTAVLAALSLFIFFSLNPLNANASWLRDVLVNTRLIKTSTILPNLASPSLPYLVAGLSVALAALGLYISKIKFGVNNLDTSTPNNGLFARLSANNFYLDNIYDTLIVKPYLYASKAASKFDKTVVDGMIDATGVMVVVGANIVHFIDHFIVDGTVNLTGSLSRFFGRITRSFQGGNVQSYLMWGMVGVLLIMIWLFQLIEWKITF